MQTLEILREKLSGRLNPNGLTVLWPDTPSIPHCTAWSTGYDQYHIIPFIWGFQLVETNGRIAPPTNINFGKYATEDDFIHAFERAMNFVKLNCKKAEALPAYLWGD